MVGPETAFSAESATPPDAGPRANGDGAWFGWPNSLQVETEVAARYDTKTLDERRPQLRRLNRAAFDHVVYAPLGLLPALSNLAQERDRHRAESAGVLLG
jgi:hypothetical protein